MNNQEIYVSYDENGLITGCGYCEEYEEQYEEEYEQHKDQNKTTICWSCKRWFTKTNIDGHYGYYCPYCKQSLRNHPIYGESIIIF